MAAYVGDAEVDEVVNYLAKYLSRLNVNKATAAELADVLDLPIEQAAAIIEYRERSGPFRNFDALESVPQVDKKKLADQRDRIAFSPATF